MKLTKEECLEAIKSIEQKTTDVEDYSSIPVSTCCYTEDELNVLEQLIYEHFDNPPLKFEEIKVGDWLWDDKYKYYRCVYYLVIHDGSFIDEGKYISFNKESYYMEHHELFEENRFYRKQVDENE